MNRALLARFLVVLLSWGLLGSAALAQGLLVNTSSEEPIRLPRPPVFWPPHPVPPSPPPVGRTYRIKSLEADVRVEDGVARVQVTQTFVNNGSTTIEAAFVFPLPADGAVDGLTLLVDGKEFTGRMLPADEARRIYQSYVQRNRDPALLEWIGHGMFQTSVFPIPPGAERKVTLNYTQVARSAFGMSEWTLPLQPAKYTSEPIEQLRIRAHLTAKGPLRNIYSPTHAVEIERPSDNTAVVTYKAERVVPANDFRLFFDHHAEALAASVLSYWPEGESEGYFLMLAMPPALERSGSPIPKTVVFVVDTSGSMSGQKFEQAREAAKFVLNNLKPDDLFNIVAYSDRVEVFRPELQRADAKSRDEALGFVAGLYAGGSTNISGALSSALEMLKDASRPNYVMFLTDGLPTTGETQPSKIVADSKEKNQVKARIFSFGVGYDVNSRLLDTLTRTHSGIVEYVRPDENIERYVSNLYRGIASPVLTGVELEFVASGGNVADGPSVTRRYPDPLPDLFANQQFTLVGKYRRPGSYEVRIKGQQDGSSREYKMPVTLGEKSSSTQFAFVARLWAARRIGEIIDKLDVEGKNQELMDELVSLSKKHGILTPFTAFLAEEPNVVLGADRLSAGVSQTVDLFAEAESGQAGFEARSLKQQLRELDEAAPNAYAIEEGVGGRRVRGLSPAMPMGDATRRGGIAFGGAVGGGGALRTSAAGLPGGPVAAPLSAPADAPVTSKLAVMTVGAKTFYRYQDQWVESEVTEEELTKARVVERFSDEYFALLDRYGDDVGQYLSIDDTVVLKLGDELVKF